MFLPGVKPVPLSWKVDVVTASPPSRTFSIEKCIFQKQVIQAVFKEVATLYMYTFTKN